MSDEEEAQIGRLVYILSHGCKENLVARPQDWPGVHCVTALLTGEPIEGTWFDRTKEWEARQRGEEFDARQFADTEVVNLAPLPCWRHLAGEQYRERIAELVEAIIAQGRRPAGGDWDRASRRGRNPAAAAVLSAGEDQKVSRAARSRRQQEGPNRDEDRLPLVCEGFSRGGGIPAGWRPAGSVSPGEFSSGVAVCTSGAVSDQPGHAGRTSRLNPKAFR